MRQAHKNVGVYSQNPVSKSKNWEYSFFLWRKAEGKPIGVPRWRPSRTTTGTCTTVCTTTGTCTTVWEPLA